MEREGEGEEEQRGEGEEGEGEEGYLHLSRSIRETSWVAEVVRAAVGWSAARVRAVGRGFGVEAWEARQEEGSWACRSHQAL